MSANIPCFTPFEQAIDDVELPLRFTFPFFYQPHPLSVLAATQLQQHLTTQQQWVHDFDTDGKMFGVLVVQDSDGQVGFLSAFSGNVADSNHLPGFVPPVFDVFHREGFFVTELAQITKVSERSNQLAANPQIAELAQQLTDIKGEYQHALAAHQQVMADGRKQRKALRREASNSASAEQLSTLNQQLAKQSIGDKHQLRDLKAYWQQLIDASQQQYSTLVDEVASLKAQRKAMSSALQHKLFAQYKFLNVAGEARDLNDIFAFEALPIPPAGAGECAAPKLLQYAFSHHLTPLAMAEFWWGRAPTSEIRQHKNFYPSCSSKCKPILGHMLEGLTLDENPLLDNPAIGKELTIVHQDEAMLVINKPHDFLSVPGKNIKDSVLTRLREQFPDADGPLIVHRLDMATSGIMLIALTQRANKSLTKQFRCRSIEKSYVALVAGEVTKDQGDINLPLRGDLTDRPRQLVCDEHGKAAQTSWQVISREQGGTRLLLRPKTGRTHQLRVHCAHQQGLGLAIVGDTLYGKQADRLHLHAFSITFEHPYTKAPMHFEVEPGF